LPRAKKDPALVAKQSHRFQIVAERFENKQLAEKLGVDTSVISKIRSGRAPTFEQMMGLAKETEYPPEYLLGLQGPKGWRLETGDHPMVMVPRLDSLETIKKRPFPDDSIKLWVQYPEKDLKCMVGELQVPKQFAQLPIAGGFLLVDQYFRLDHIRSDETFIVQHRAELSVCKISVYDDEIICKEVGKSPIRVGLGKREAMYNLLIARVLAKTVHICEHEVERWD
jgi:transcriptional regulator with XRE-family HTH domain